MRPGGRFATLVWSSPDKTPFHSIFTDVVARYREAAGLPVAAGYSLGTPDILGGALGAAGFADVRVERVGHTRRFASVAAARQTLVQEFPARAATADALSEADRKSALAEIEAGYGRFAGPDGVVIPGEVLVAAGTR